ncbi:RrF2 family transcriptional regulator [Rhodoferax antarcticus]|uniref:Rrf2 family transcriptional regulator n=1 Tax=Rhodoferax antarcticus ANT.BR TaxID=1111071 RepID=A0A1Q8YI83_9BURK|nr:Rrf2 family transcriptional regulator [Rhodoferax antarcticus]APW47881.1 Rrf2 family transcriptional regulator [Rhodoferax antarcticus]MCW2312269.1 Rrf2 family nitric oxide-sensitive transcriptional repressor [Rhodoferax antarcticus]OLP07653.1 Rrf2 family transcriptional regulator [Rhodoferax antarcticus ANT.BR]
MRLTTMTDYAMRLLMYVAQQQDRLCTIAEIAKVYDISEAHLMKVTHQLGLNGWLETVRGKGGGMRLAAAPADINLGAVVRSIEPDFYLVDCLNPDTVCSLTGYCKLTGIMSGALQNMMQYLDGYTLADLLPPKSPARAAHTPLLPLSGSLLGTPLVNRQGLHSLTSKLPHKRLP